jgi:hypothetical protein
MTNTFPLLLMMTTTIMNERFCNCTLINFLDLDSQLPVFKHRLEPLRTTVLPSTSQPPSNINLRNLNSLQRNKVIQWLTSLVVVLLHCSTLSASVSSAPTLHFLFFSIYTLCTMSLSCNLPLLFISTPVLCLLAHTSIFLHNDHKNSNNNGNHNLISSLHCVLIVSVHLVHAMCALDSASHSVPISSTSQVLYLILIVTLHLLWPFSHAFNITGCYAEIPQPLWQLRLFVFSVTVELILSVSITSSFSSRIALHAQSVSFFFYTPLTDGFTSPFLSQN